MSPTYKESGVLPGESVRLVPGITAPDANPREKWQIISGPVHGNEGIVVLQSQLTGETMTVTADDPIIREVVRD